MSNNPLIRPVLALLTGVLLLGIFLVMLRTFNRLPNLTAVERTSPSLTVDFQKAELTPEIPLSSPSRTLSVTSTALAVASSPLVESTVFKTIFTTRPLHVALRAGPHINHPGASKNYDKGTPMEVLGTRDSWYFVIAPDGAKGWLYEEWLNIDSAVLNTIPVIMIIPTAPLNTRVPPDRDPQEPMPNPYP